MSDKIFNAECDRLSRLVDPEGAEQAEWQGKYGTKLDTVIDLAQKAFEDRDDLSLVKASTEPQKHSFTLTYQRDKLVQIVTVWFAVSGGAPIIWAEPIPGTRYDIDARRHYRNENGKPDEEWIPAVMADIMTNVQER